MYWILFVIIFFLLVKMYFKWKLYKKVDKMLVNKYKDL